LLVYLIHLALLHKEGSNSPIGSDTGIDDVTILSIFCSQRCFCFLLFYSVFCYFCILFSKCTLNHPDNYIPADPLQTPAHVVPEWYFLPYYAILRSIPHKAGGIVAMLGSI
jgi:ubiquinol-cytochrome c reductase cytochrome b subunit